MSVLIFIIILSVLIFVHELGHFLAAKKFGIRVDEFGIGYPPRAAKLFSWRGTEFTLNWLPFGGFVKIFGENPTEELEQEKQLPLTNSSDVSSGKRGQNLLDVAGSPAASGDNFQHKNRGIQASVLFAGVFFNFLFAWLLISFGFMTGLAAPLGTSLPVENPETMITTVLPGSPAAEAGLKSGDVIIRLSRGEAKANLNPAEASNFISSSVEPITFEVMRGNETKTLVATPEYGIIPEKPAVGIAMDIIGTVKLNPIASLWHGLKVSIDLTVLTAKALGTFIAQAVVGRADLSQVTGPVGIVSMVGDVKELGFSFILSFTALISINLAIINLVPFPALDGGRLLIVGIEAIRRKPISPKIFNVANTVGFGLLILLMILITIRDVRNIF